MKEKNASNYVSKHKWQYVCSLSISFFGPHLQSIGEGRMDPHRFIKIAEHITLAICQMILTVVYKTKILAA